MRGEAEGRPKCKCPLKNRMVYINTHNLKHASTGRTESQDNNNNYLIVSVYNCIGTAVPEKCDALAQWARRRQKMLVLPSNQKIYVFIKTQIYDPVDHICRRNAPLNGRTEGIERGAAARITSK